MTIRNSGLLSSSQYAVLGNFLTISSDACGSLVSSSIKLFFANSLRYEVSVGHGNTNCAIVEWWLQLSLRFPVDFVFDFASITWLGISPFSHREIRKINETAHLQIEGLDDSIPP